MKRERAVVLLSGGVDSTICLDYAVQRCAGVDAIAFDYGQRNAAELEAARAICDVYGVHLRVVRCSSLAELGGSALTSDMAMGESGGYADARVPGGLPTTFVPGRNLIFLGIAAAHAVQRQARILFIGACKGDSSPDASIEFLVAASAAITAAMPTSVGPIEVHAPLVTFDKADLLREARTKPRLWSALGLSVTCYEGARPGCGRCVACQRRAAGCVEAGVPDPVSGA